MLNTWPGIHTITGIWLDLGHVFPASWNFAGPGGALGAGIGPGVSYHALQPQCGARWQFRPQGTLIF